MPSVFFSLQFNASLHYLQAMNIFSPGMIITFITTCIHPLWLYIFLAVFGCGIKGIGYSMGITNFLNFIIALTYLYYNNPEPKTFLNFDENSVSFKRIYDYLRLAVPSAIMFSADWLGFHILILFSSYIDLNCLLVNVCLFNFVTLLYSIPAGISFAVCILIGNSIGAMQVKMAKIFSIVAAISGVFAIFIITFLIQFFKSSFPYLYTTDDNIAKAFSEMLPFFIYFGTLDALQIILNSVLKGLGKQRYASYLVIIILYPINIPMTITFAFSLNYKLIGLWYSQLTAVVFLNFSYLIMIMSLDWDNNAQRTFVKIDHITEKLQKKCRMLEAEYVKL